MQNEWHVAVIDASGADLQTISAVPAICKGWYINSLLASGQPILKNVTTVRLRLPNATAEGDAGDFDGAIFEDSLIADSASVATGEYVIFWKERERL